MGTKRHAAPPLRGEIGRSKASRGETRSSRRHLDVFEASPPEFSLSNVVSSARRSAEQLLPTELVTRLFDEQAKTIFLTKDKESWIYHVPGWFKTIYEHSEGASNGPRVSYEDWFEHAWETHPQHYDTFKIFGKEAVMHRFQLACGGADYRFSGSTFRASPFPAAFDAAVKQMQNVVVDASSKTSRLNTGLINWYENGDHYMGPHSDSEKIILPQSPIFALSLGATRRFVFTKRPNPKEKSTTKGEAKSKKKSDAIELMLNDGDLIVMGGTTQLTHKHALPKMKACKARRISVTLRCFNTDG